MSMGYADRGRGPKRSNVPVYASQAGRAGAPLRRVGFGFACRRSPGKRNASAGEPGATFREQVSPPAARPKASMRDENGSPWLAKFGHGRCYSGL